MREKKSKYFSLRGTITQELKKVFIKSFLSWEQRSPALLFLALFALGAYAPLDAGLSGVYAFLAISVGSLSLFLVLGLKSRWSTAAWCMAALMMGLLGAQQARQEEGFWKELFSKAGFVELHFVWQEDVYLNREKEGCWTGFVKVSPLSKGGWEDWLYSRRFKVRYFAEEQALPKEALCKGYEWKAKVAVVPSGKQKNAIPFWLSLKPDLKSSLPIAKNRLWHYRAIFIKFMEKRFSESFSSTPVGFFRSMISANRKELGTGDYNHLGRLGLRHLLALSGLHVFIVFFSSLWFFSLFRLEKWSGLLSLAVVIVYATLGGWGYPLFRAVGILTLGIWAKNQGRGAPTLNFLAFLAAAELVVDVSLVYSPSFSLTYLGTAGVVWGGHVVGLLQKRLKSWRKNALGRMGLELLRAYAFSWGAMLFTLPAVAFFFGVVPSWAFLLSVPWVMLFSAVLVLALVCSLVLLFRMPELSSFLEKPILWYLDSLSFFSSQGAWVDTVTPASAIWLWGYYGALLGLYLYASSVLSLTQD